MVVGGDVAEVPEVPVIVVLASVLVPVGIEVLSSRIAIVAFNRKLMKVYAVLALPREAVQSSMNKNWSVTLKKRHSISHLKCEKVFLPFAVDKECLELDRCL